MIVYGEGSHVGMLLDVATPDTVEAQKRGCQETPPARRVHQSLPDQEIEDEDEVFKDALVAGPLTWTHPKASCSCWSTDLSSTSSCKCSSSC